MLNICFTFDYELFLGDNKYSDEKTLFEPTDKLIELLCSEDISATFFADVCSVSTAKKYGVTGYVDHFNNQIQKMILKGQDVQLHIHPHWIDSKFCNGKWVFNSSRYRLNSFSFDKSEKNNVAQIVSEGIKYLTDTLRKVDGNYKCIAYRAGGYSIQPHNNIVKVLYENGIRVDSSVCVMQYADTPTNKYDYRKKIPYINWMMSPEKEWWQNIESDCKGLYEIPIATENKNPIVFAFKRTFKPNEIKLNLGEYRGSYMKTSNSDQGKSLKKILAYLCGYNLISMDAYRAKFIYTQLKRFYVKHKCNEFDGTVALVGHPKLINSNYLDNLDVLIKMLKKDNRFKISNISTIYNNRTNQL